MKYNALRDCSLLSGIGICVVDSSGREFFATQEYQKVRNALERLADGLELNGQVADSLVKGCRYSIEYGGIYTYTCPRGLTFVTTPLSVDSAAQRFIVGGPVILNSKDDYLDFEVLPALSNAVDIREIRALIDCIPVRQPTTVAAFSDQLFINAAYISGGRLAINSLAKGDDSKIDKLYSVENVDEQLRDKSYMFESEKEVLEQTRLLKALRSDVNLPAKALYREIVQQIIFHPRNNLDTIKHKAIELIIMLSANAKQKGADVKLLTQLRNRFFLEIDELESLDKFIPWMNRLFEQFQNNTFNSTDPDHAAAIREVITYILNHYDERITLEDVAAHVAFSPSYLCVLLRKEMGQNFKSCLNRIRVEKSKTLFLDPNLNISAIAHRVGYSDHSYFARVFRKFEGVSPYEYRMAIKSVNLPDQED
jgi:AraC-like DNA-binding protein/ligand-binding sensor protein